MNRWFSLWGMILLWVSGFVWPAQGAEKVKFATAARSDTFYNLLAGAAQEKGFWQQSGLEVEWIPFAGGGAMHKAVAAGVIAAGLTGAAGLIQAATAGVPEVIVADVGKQDYFIWVRSPSPIKEPKELKGAKIGINRFGGLVHSYGRLAARALALEDDIKFVAGGGAREEIAAIKVGKLDGRVSTFGTMASVMLAGAVRPLINVGDFLPKDWIDITLFAQKELIEKQPEIAQKVVKAILQASDFVRRNPGWAWEKIKIELSIPEAVSKEVYSSIQYNREGKISRAGLKGVVNFLIDYRIISPEKAPALDKLYTSRFTE